MTSNNESTMFRAALRRLDDAAACAGVAEEIVDRLKRPRRVVQATLVLRRDDGRQELLPAFRVLHDDSRGPGKGGIRFHPRATLDEATTLAFWMTCKCAVAGLPFGGAKGAVTVDPRGLSRTERERISRAYARAFADVLGTDRDIPAPDVYTDETVMAWIADELSVINREQTPGAITGKPVSVGGIPGRDDATARGGHCLLRKLATSMGWRARDTRVAIHGFGNAGMHLASLLAGNGYRVVAAADSRDAVHEPDGFDVESLVRHKSETGRLPRTGKRMEPEEIVTVEAEVLVPAALENFITAENAGSVNAAAILEVANGPVHPDADDALRDRSVEIVPDILGSAGGVTVSYFEWVQNRTGALWTREAVYERLEAMLSEQYERVEQTAAEHGIDRRTAAYTLALSRLGEAIGATGG